MGFKCLRNQAGVGVDVAADGEDGDLAVGEGEEVREGGAGHHGGDFDESVGDVEEVEGHADFLGEGGGVVAEEDYWWGAWSGGGGG